MPKISIKTYQKAVQKSKIFKQLDKDFQQRMLHAPEDRREFYLDLLKTLEEDIIKASTQFYTETVTIIQEFKQNYAKAKRVVAHKVEVRVQQEETSNLENIISEIPTNSP